MNFILVLNAYSIADNGMSPLLCHATDSYKAYINADRLQTENMFPDGDEDAGGDIGHEASF